MKRESKQAKILRHFLTGQTLNVFEAEPLGDHCLNSTVSTLSNLCGLQFDREWETVPTRFGIKVRVMRYRLAESSRDAAEALLMRWREKGDGDAFTA